MRTKVISDNLQIVKKLHMKVLTISIMHNPKKTMLYMNHEKKMFPIFIQEKLLYCDSCSIHIKYLQHNILFQYTVPIQETNNYYVGFFLHIITNKMVKNMNLLMDGEMFHDFLYK